jgi:tetratricopeptide (TPR) repeat protein
MAAQIAAASDPRQWLHAADYMVYAHLQLGQEREAKAIVDQILALPRVPEENFVAAHAVAAIPARYAIERGRWQDAARLALSPPEPDFAWQQFPNAEAVLVYARGLGAARAGDLPGARREVERLGKLKEAMLEGNLRYWADQADIQVGVVNAWIARGAGRNDEALRLMRAAADHEDSTEKNTVTPGPLKPARELLGELLLDLGRPVQALPEFEATMRKEPNRLQGLYGAARAAELAGDASKAGEYYAKLATLGDTADPSQTEVATAKRFLARR